MQTPKAPDWVDETLAEYPKLLTSDEVIAILRTTQRNFYRLVATHRLRTVRPATAGSSRHLVPKSEVARYLRSLEVAA
jgi:excisionase family DNA binding protein